MTVCFTTQRKFVIHLKNKVYDLSLIVGIDIPKHVDTGRVVGVKEDYLVCIATISSIMLLVMKPTVSVSVHKKKHMKRICTRKRKM